MPQEIIFESFDPRDERRVRIFDLVTLDEGDKVISTATALKFKDEEDALRLEYAGTVGIYLLSMHFINEEELQRKTGLSERDCQVMSVGFLPWKEYLCREEIENNLKVIENYLFLGEESLLQTI
jgi:hypothetical protein